MILPCLESLPSSLFLSCIGIAGHVQVAAANTTYMAGTVLFNVLCRRAIGVDIPVGRLLTREEATDGAKEIQIQACLVDLSR